MTFNRAVLSVITFIATNASEDQLQPALPILIVSSHKRTVYAGPTLFPNVKGYLQKGMSRSALYPLFAGCWCRAAAIDGPRLCDSQF
jgi:hypothetical protein